MGEWIKCSERMPDEMGPKVLVCVVYRDGSPHSELFGDFMGGKFYDDRDDHSDEMKDYEIWYWQPFPDPPSNSSAPPMPPLDRGG